MLTKAICCICRFTRSPTECVGGDDTCALLCQDMDLFIWGGLEKDIGVIPWWKNPPEGTEDAWGVVLWSCKKSQVVTYIWKCLYTCSPEHLKDVQLSYLFLVVVIRHRDRRRQGVDDFRRGWRTHLWELLGDVVYIDLNFCVIKFFFPIRSTVVRIAASKIR